VAQKAMAGCILVLARTFDASQAARRSLLSPASDLLRNVTEIIRRATVHPQEVDLFLSP
jgi:hypothetical protein